MYTYFHFIYGSIDENFMTNSSRLNLFGRMNQSDEECTRDLDISDNLFILLHIFIISLLGIISIPRRRVVSDFANTSIQVPRLVHIKSLIIISYNLYPLVHYCMIISF